MFFAPIYRKKKMFSFFPLFYYNDFEVIRLNKVQYDQKASSYENKIKSGLELYITKQYQVHPRNLNSNFQNKKR